MTFIKPPFPKKPILGKEELLRTSNIFDNAGQVVFGIMVLSPIISEIDKRNLLMITSGVVATLLFWFLSILLIRTANKL